MACNTATVDREENPVALFYLLEDARRQQDFGRAAEMQKKLAELGVVVTYNPKRRQPQ